MYLKINYPRPSILLLLFRVLLTGIVVLFFFGVKISSGLESSEIKKKLIYYQKYSTGKKVNFYKTIAEGYLEPGSYNVLTSHKPLVGFNEEFSWSLSSKNRQYIPSKRTPFYKIPLDISDNYFEKPFGNSRILYLDFTEEYVDKKNQKNQNVINSIVMLQVFIKDKKLNRKLVIYAPYLYIAGHISLPDFWAPKTLWYVIRRELGLPPNSIGRISKNDNSWYFKVRLHKKMDDYYAMRVIVDGLQYESSFLDLKPTKSMMRLGVEDDFSYSEKITMDTSLTNEHPDIVATSYLYGKYSGVRLKDKSNLYLEELTFNFSPLKSPENINSFVKEVSLYKPSTSKLPVAIHSDSYESIVLNPRFIRDIGKGIGRLELDLSDLSKNLKKEIIVNEFKIIKANLIVNARESIQHKVMAFRKNGAKVPTQNNSEVNIPNTLKKNLKLFEFTPETELVIFKNKKYLNSDDLLDKVSETGGNLKRLSTHVEEITTSQSNRISFTQYLGTSFVILLYIFLIFVMKNVIGENRPLEIPSYFISLGFLLCISGFLISLFTSGGAYNQVYGANFFFKDIFFTLGGIILALSWGKQSEKIHIWLKSTRWKTLEIFFKNYNSSYITLIIVAIILCVLSNRLYFPMTELFSSIAISFIIVGAWYHFNKDPKYDTQSPTIKDQKAVDKIKL